MTPATHDPATHSEISRLPIANRRQTCGEGGCKYPKTGRRHVRHDVCRPGYRFGRHPSQCAQARRGHRHQRGPGPTAGVHQSGNTHSRQNPLRLPGGLPLHSRLL